MQSATASELTNNFLQRTGVESDKPDQRYLWTDSYAVCNLVGAWRVKPESGALEQARDLVAAVHESLGRHREDDRRKGWLDDADEVHPTRGGLRIGKPRPERRPGQQQDRELEWERDGQYFHYLTRWMHALDQMARATGEAFYIRAALELAAAAYDGFVYHENDEAKMYWKMSIDLSRPLVRSMGHHDPLDGWVTILQLKETSDRLEQPGEMDFEGMLEAYQSMIEDRDLTTDDALGIGGLLQDATRLAQISGPEHLHAWPLFRDVLSAAKRGLGLFERRYRADAIATSRLAFRELGLAIGIRGAELLWEIRHEAPVFGSNTLAVERLETILDHRDLAEEITGFWSSESNRDNSNWESHRDINEVMLATALEPQGFLVLD